VFHTIEGEPSEAGFRALARRHPSPPHLWAMPSADLLLQVIPLDRAAYALGHPPGTVDTNRMGAIQVECWGFARDMGSVSTQTLDWLARRLLAPVVQMVPINLAHVRTTSGDECYGAHSACRMSESEWRSFDGVCGHQHVPGNSHWDPGRLDLAAIAARAASILAGGPASAETSASESTPDIEAEVVDDAAIHDLSGDAEALNDSAESAARRSAAAQLEWQDLSLTTGGDGQRHLYYLTSGPPGGGPSHFRLKVTNTNSVYNFKNPSIKLRLRASAPGGLWRLVPLEGQGQAGWKRIASPPVEDEHSHVAALFLDAATRYRAYDADNPLHWLDAEYHWYEGGLGSYSPHYASTSLGFFLVAPVELLLSQRKHVVDVPLNDAASREYWHHVWGNSDPAPVEFTLTLQTSVTDTDTGQLTVSSSTTLTRASEGSIQTTATQELSAGFGIEKMFSLGAKLGTSVTTGVRWTDSIARQLTSAASRTRSFTEGHQRQSTLKGTIPAAPPGRRQVLYAYPVMGVYEIPVVMYGGANDLGQATRRATDRVPVAWLQGWEQKVVTE
jgi:hypothetical protein